MSVLDLTARELAATIATGAAAPDDVIDELERSISRLPDDLNPFIAIDLDHARDEARMHAALPPEQRGVLHGVPLPIKDLERTAHLPTTFGLPFALDPSSTPADGSFAARARTAGAMMYAKTNTSALGHKDVTENLVVGVTTHPMDRTRTPGGSSGGAAAAVAAGLGPVAHGTDAGGSVRFPASLCGLVGFKPSFGRLSRVPVADLWAARGHHGFLTRDVGDVAFLMDALSGHDRRDPLSPPGSWRDGHVAAAPRILSLTTMFGQRLNPGVDRAFAAALARLESAGLQIERGEITWQDPIPDGNVPMAARDWRLLGARAEQSPELFERSHLEVIHAGSMVTTTDLLRAQESRSRLYSDAVALFDGCDLLVTPTMPITAWRWDDEHPIVDGTPIELGPGGRWMDLLLANPPGWPSISVPGGWSDGLPVGLQITAPPTQDLACIAFAATAEEILEFDPTSPPIPEGRR